MNLVVTVLPIPDTCDVIGCPLPPRFRVTQGEAPLGVRSFERAYCADHLASMLIDWNSGF